MHGSGKKFIRDVFYSLIPVSVNKLSSLLYLPLIFKYAGAVAYGIWQQFGLSSQVILHVATMNVGVGIKKYLSQTDDRIEVSRSFYSSLAWVFVLSIGCSGVLLLGRQPIGSLLFTRGYNESLIVLLSLYIPLEAILFEIGNVLRAIRQVRFLAIMGPVRVIAKLLTVTVALTYFDAAIQQAISYFIVSELVMLLIYLFVLWTHVGLRSILLDLSRGYKFVSYGLPFVLAGISTWSSAFSDRFVLLHFHGIDVVGVYSAAYVLASIPLLLVNPVSQILLPDLSALLGHGKRQRAIVRAERVMLFYSLITGAFALLVTVAGPAAMKWLDHESSDTGRLMMLLALAMGAYGLLTLQSNVLTAFLKRAYFNIVWVAIALGNIGMNLLLIPEWGMTGAAIASLVTYALGSMAMGFLLRGKIGWRYLVWVSGMIGFGVALGALLNRYWLIRDLISWQVIGALSTGLGVYALLTFALFGKRLLTITKANEG